MSAVVFAAGRAPEAAVIEKATEEGIVLFGSALPAFELVGRMYELGIRGRHE
jgi:hypothetical protein